MVLILKMTNQHKPKNKEADWVQIKYLIKEMNHSINLNVKATKMVVTRKLTNHQEPINKKADRVQI